jgi:S-DNA-T family DNA segregation ATPase FtsK/SpoIIIE
MERTKKVSKNTFKNKADNKKSTVKSFDFGLGSLFLWNLRWSNRFRKWLAFFVFLLGMFLVISFASYIHYGLADQSLYQQSFDTLAKNAKNLGGAVGAYLAYIFVFNGFGFISILLPIWLIGLSIVIFFNKGWNKLTYGFLYLTFLLYFISLTLGWFTIVLGWSSIEIAGSIGLSLAEWSAMFIGNLGLGFILLLILVLFVSYHLQNSYLWAKKLFQWIPNLNAEVSKPQKEPSNHDPLETAEQKSKIKNDDDFIISFKKDGVVHSKDENPKDWKNSDETQKTLHTEPSNKGQNSDDDKDELEDKTSIDLEVTPKSHFEDRKKGEISFEIEEGVKEAPVLVLNNDEVFVNIAKNEEEEFVKIIPDEDRESLSDGEDVGDWEMYDPTKDLSSYQYPTIDLLAPLETPKNTVVNREELEENKNKIVKTLQDYKIEITHIKATVGPTVTLYEIIPAPGVKISKIKGLEDDIALSLAALGIRIIAPMPGKGTIGIEIPNSHPEIVPFRSVIATEKFRDTKAELPVVLGKTIANEVFIADLTKMPHLLVAGATGQGKSVGLNGIIASILYKKHPSQVKFVLIDPKKVELSLFQKLENHFLAKLPNFEDAIITDVKQVVTVLTSLCQEMDDRYDLLKIAGVRNITEYNNKFINRKLNPKYGHRFLPYIVLIIDELADLMMTAGKEVETPIARLAQLARAIGIHLVVATQRPSVNVITGIIKANFPARISFRVISKVDSRTILDTNGADQLIGRGDLLFSNGSDLIRIQNPFIDTKEVEEVVNFIASQKGYPDAYMLPEVRLENDEPSFDDEEDGLRDSMFEEAARLIVKHQHGSTSLIQRRLKLGYNRAGRIMDQLEKAGIVGPTNGSKPREVLIKSETELESYL